MPQLFQVLRCYKCFVFQVHLTKKSNKWDCKLCGEKQSIKRHYGLGTAKDCRIHVQKLNGIRGETEGEVSSVDSDEEIENIDNVSNVNAQLSDNVKKPESKWLEYIENTEEHLEPNTEEMYLGDSEVVLEIPRKKMKRFNRNICNKENSAIENVLHAPNKDSIGAETCNSCDRNEILKEVNSFDIAIKVDQLCYQNIESQFNLINKPKQNTINSGVARQEKNDVSSVINKHSKWAQFVQEPENIINDSGITCPVSQPEALFSLCDDDALDDILNF